ncbi:ABC transporter permease [Brevundimonas sp. AJA228-03]|uniref:cell division protein FtsX n=1 Tax=Brevundimonas sp. AJA228-03 TaxID=2752515 RepID=UPI001ADFCA58|nr:FtsX-like permease family protein [Brevundimonas sp. AJA228-03]QTN19786.1 ABC transporter permease [Brevundimonas sp. AJA228-03]
MIRWSTLFGPKAAPKPVRPESGLLPRDPGGERSLGALIAVLCFLACLAAVGTLAADRASHGWARALRAEATVQVRPRVGETGPAAAARAAETLAGVNGVEEAEAMDREAAEALLRPWMGEAVLNDLPIPFLVTVRLEATAPASALSLSRALAEAGIDATVDDHSLWRGEVERSARVISLLALAAFLATAFAAGAAIAYATRAGLDARRDVIETLSLSGATDAGIVWMFQRRFGLLAGAAGAVGATVAILLIGGLRALGGDAGLTPALPLAWSDIILLTCCPIVAAAVALVSAWLAAVAALGGRTRPD